MHDKEDQQEQISPFLLQQGMGHGGCGGGCGSIVLLFLLLWASEKILRLMADLYKFVATNF